MILEQMQHVLGAQEGPVSQQSVVFVRQSAPATDGDQPRITLLREDRHTPIPTIHEATDQVSNALFALGSAGRRWLDRPADLETGRVSAEWFLSEVTAKNQAARPAAERGHAPPGRAEPGA